ncbi:MAG TPA: PSD1 and planctomycete cytochrome C domain-containing protein, partial [Bryobacteraceae bacterium]|nr:PSD1 and planctomycete cytochrome C domain-containing protein [Bryobacteraceae bacterium]
MRILLKSFSLPVVVACALWGQDSSLEHFEKKIRPVLAARCHACHGSSTALPQGGLRLDSVGGIRKGGNSGPIFQAGDPDRSLLVRALRHQDAALKMPPGKPLDPEIISDFEKWIRLGASMPEAPSETAQGSKPVLWSLQKVVRPAPPGTRNNAWARTDIDRFILSRLEAGNLSPSPQADKRTLIRRAYYDLTGLPPTAEEIEGFVKDTAPDSWRRLIDRLLASPRYGERWARHWLDVARYADSVNDSVNAGQRYPWSYTYRDWVINALNEDLPYDRFLLYQLAADRVKGLERRHLAALGFLSLGREFPKSYPETVDDRIDAVTRGMMGLTVSCARCHDHKYDPIPTKDYYSLYGILANIRQPAELPELAPAAKASPRQLAYAQRLERINQADKEYRARRNAEMVAFFKSQTADYLMAAHDAEYLSNPQVEELIRERQLNQHVLNRWRQYLAKSKSTGEPVFRLWHAAVAIPGVEFAAKWPAILASVQGNRIVHAELKKRNATTLRELASAYADLLAQHDVEQPSASADIHQLRAVLRGPASPVDIPVEEFPLIYTEGDSNNTRAIRVRYNTALAHAAYDGAPPRAMAVENVPEPVAARVFVRGNPSNPGALTPPHFLSCLGGDDKQVFRADDERLDLARAIISPDNPLTARTVVNRVWMHHFGFGLVRTPSDFGFRGDKPTHPELLDYLAVKLIESGWSLKALHRLIMTSAVYTQASDDNSVARGVDPENLLLWRMNRRRLDIESLRDAMLKAAGRLDLKSGGVPFSLTAQPSVPRRSVYGFIERGRLPGFLSSFDFASPDQHAPLRFVTTVPQQALFFLNSPFVVEQAGHTAARPEVASAESDQKRIQQMYRLLFGRDPEPRELKAGLAFVGKPGEANAPPPSPSAWHYGVASYRAEAARVDSFAAFPIFTQDRWQGGPSIPAARFGKATLTPTGGEPGEQMDQAVVRRWISPISGKLNIEGTL